MQYEILDIVPGAGDADVLVTVAYWYDNTSRGKKKFPDYVEHHLIVGVTYEPLPIVNRLGQYLGTDGVLISPWIEVNGDWVNQAPDMALVQHVDPDIEAQILNPVDRQAQDIFVRRPPSVADLIPQKDLKQSNKADHFAKRPVVTKNKGRVRQVDL